MLEFASAAYEVQGLAVKPGIQAVWQVSGLAEPMNHTVRVRIAPERPSIGVDESVLGSGVCLSCAYACGILDELHLGNQSHTGARCGSLEYMRGCDCMHTLIRSLELKCEVHLFCPILRKQNPALACVLDVARHLCES